MCVANEEQRSLKHGKGARQWKKGDKRRRRRRNSAEQRYKTVLPPYNNISIEKRSCLEGSSRSSSSEINQRKWTRVIFLLFSLEEIHGAPPYLVNRWHSSTPHTIRPTTQVNISTHSYQPQYCQQSDVVVVVVVVCRERTGYAANNRRQQ